MDQTALTTALKELHEAHDYCGGAELSADQVNALIEKLRETDAAGTSTSLDYNEMTEAQRLALPAEHHVPVWVGSGTPPMWLCAVCWGENYGTQWPCDVARQDGAPIAHRLGLEATR